MTAAPIGPGGEGRGQGVEMSEEVTSGASLQSNSAIPLSRAVSKSVLFQNPLECSLIGGISRQFFRATPQEH